MKASFLALAGLALGLTLALPAVAQDAGKLKEKAANDEPQIDRSRMVDFTTLLPKRADLRVRVAKAGFDQAYAEWLQGQAGGQDALRMHRTPGSAAGRRPNRRTRSCVIARTS